MRSTRRRVGTSGHSESVELRVACCSRRLSTIGLPIEPADSEPWISLEPRGQLVEPSGNLNVVCAACGSDTLLGRELVAEVLSSWRDAYLAGTVERTGEYDVKRVSRR